jgi:Helix-turn-helix domain
MSQYPLRDKPLYNYTRDELLEEIVSAADHAYLKARHAAAFLNTTEQTLANWRQKKRGPKFNRIDRFIRYRLGDLKDFMETGRDHNQGGA